MHKASPVELRTCIEMAHKRIAELEAWVEYTRAAYVRAKDKGDLIRVITRQPTGFYAYVPCN